MSTEITINNITGATPFDVYLCDTSQISCVYISTITTTPFVFNVPTLLEGQTSYVLKIIDDNDCIITQTLTP
jgi:hypothetical protein